MGYLTVCFVLITIHLPNIFPIITRQIDQDLHSGDTYSQTTTNWLTGLKESTFRAFVRQGWVEPGLRENLYSAEVVGPHQTISPFGDISILARGQLYFSSGRLIFVKDHRLYDCEECRETATPEAYGQILALWAVKRIRHRLQNDNVRYEVEYKISPVTNGSLKPNGHFNYDIPGHVFLLNDNSRDSKWRRQPKNEYLPPSHNKDRYYLPPETTAPSVFYYTKKNYQYFTEKPPTTASNLEREIELYNELLQTLKNNQKLTSTTGFVPQTTTTGSTIGYSIVYPKPNAHPIAKPIDVNEDIPIFGETFRPSLEYTPPTITTTSFKPSTSHVGTMTTNPIMTTTSVKPSTSQLTTMTTTPITTTMTTKPFKPSPIYTMIITTSGKPAKPTPTSSQYPKSTTTTPPETQPPPETTIFQIQETSFKPSSTYASTTSMKPTEEMKTTSTPFSSSPSTTQSTTSTKPTMKIPLTRATKKPMTTSTTKKTKTTRKKLPSDDIFGIFPTRKSSGATVAAARPTENVFYQVTEQMPPPDHVASATETYLAEETVGYQTTSEGHETTNTPSGGGHTDYPKPSPLVPITTIGDVVQIETSKSTTSGYDITEITTEEMLPPLVTTRITEKQDETTPTTPESTTKITETTQTSTPPVSTTITRKSTAAPVLTTITKKPPRLTTTTTESFQPASPIQKETTVKPELGYTRPVQEKPIPTEENLLRPSGTVATSTVRVKTTRKYTRFEKTTSAPTRGVTKKKPVVSTTPKTYTTKKIKKYKYTKIPKRTTTTKTTTKVVEEIIKSSETSTAATTTTTTEGSITEIPQHTTPNETKPGNTTTTRTTSTPTTMIPMITIQEISTVYLPSLNTTSSKQPIIKRPTKPITKLTTTKTRVPSMELTPPTMVPLATPDTKEIFDDIFGKYSKATMTTLTTRRKPKPNAEVDSLFTGSVKRKTSTRQAKKTTASKIETTPKPSTTSLEVTMTTEMLTTDYGNDDVASTKEEAEDGTPKIIFSGFYQPSTTPPGVTTEEAQSSDGDGKTYMTYAMEEMVATTEELSSVNADDFSVDVTTIDYGDDNTTDVTILPETEKFLVDRVEASASSVIKNVTIEEHAIEAFDHLALSVLNNARVIKYLSKKRKVGKRRKKMVKRKNS